MNVLIICYSNLWRDPRVLRQIRYLSSHSVVTAGYEPPDSNLEFIELGISKLSIFQRFWKLIMLILRVDELVYWSKSRKKDFTNLRDFDFDFDLIVANDLETLPVALKLSKERPGSRVIFDAHEFYPGTAQGKDIGEQFLYLPYIRRCCRKFLSKADHVTTVSEGIRKLYAKEFGIDSSIIRNTGKFWELCPSSVNPDSIQLVHHGYALPARKIETMINLVEKLDSRFVMNFYLVPAPHFEDYHCKLKNLAEKQKERIQFHCPVPTDQIPSELNKYDIGIFILPPINENYANALPNKFFEFIQARLMITIGPSPDMRNLVNKHDLGIVSDDFDPTTVASKLNQLTVKQIEQYKNNSDQAAEELSEKHDKRLFKEILKELAYIKK